MQPGCFARANHFHILGLACLRAYIIEGTGCHLRRFIIHNLLIPSTMQPKTALVSEVMGINVASISLCSSGFIGCLGSKDRIARIGGPSHLNSREFWEDVLV